MENQEALIHELLLQKREVIKLSKWWKDEIKITEKLSAENSKLREENKLILSDKVSDIIGLLLLENNAKRVSEYMDIAVELRDKMRELQDYIHDDLKEEKSLYTKRLEEKNKRLERNYKAMLFSFFVMFGSWLVLVIKLFI